MATRRLAFRRLDTVSEVGLDDAKDRDAAAEICRAFGASDASAMCAIPLRSRGGTAAVPSRRPSSAPPAGETPPDVLGAASMLSEFGMSPTAAKHAVLAAHAARGAGSWMQLPVPRRRSDGGDAPALRARPSSSAAAATAPRGSATSATSATSADGSATSAGATPGADAESVILLGCSAASDGGAWLV